MTTRAVRPSKTCSRMASDRTGAGLPTPSIAKPRRLAPRGTELAGPRLNQTGVGESQQAGQWLLLAGELVTAAAGPRDCQGIHVLHSASSASQRFLRGTRALVVPGRSFNQAKTIVPPSSRTSPVKQKQGALGLGGGERRRGGPRRQPLSAPAVISAGSEVRRSAEAPTQSYSKI